MGPESIAPSETPSQASYATTAPPTESPSLANAAGAAAAPPPPAEYKKVDGDSKRTKKILLIVCFKLLCLVVCIISIAVGVSAFTDSTAYKATMDDKRLCDDEICKSGGRSSVCVLGFFTWYLPDPGWINKFVWFQGLSISTVLLGFLILSIYGCWYAASGCNKAWPVDLTFQLIMAIMVGAAGILLLLSILDITGKGKRPFGPTCESRFTEDSSYDEKLDKGNGSTSTSTLPENLPPTDAEIKEMTKFPGVMAAAVLAILDALLFVACALLIAFLTPKEPPPEVPAEKEETQQVVIFQQSPPPPPPGMMYQQQPVMYQQQPMMYQQQPSGQPSQMYMQQPPQSGPAYYPPQQPGAYY